jgi:hypothetical protein
VCCWLGIYLVVLYLSLYPLFRFWSDRWYSITSLILM